MGNLSLTTTMRALDRMLLLYFSMPINELKTPSLTIYYNLFRYRIFSLDYAHYFSKPPGLALSFQILRHLCLTITVLMTLEVKVSISTSALDAGLSLSVY